MTEMNYLAALPEIWMAVAGMALLLIGAFRGDRSTRAIGLAAMTVLIATLILVLTGSGAPSRALAFGGLFTVDSFAIYAKSLVLVAAAISIFMALGYNEREGMARFEIPLLMLFATLGMLMMISANDLISLYVGLELQSLALYVIAAVRRDTLRSTEAGLKYFVLGALSSGMLLYGASLIYGFTGATGFDAIATAIQAKGAEPGLGLIIGLVFLCAGLAFKISAVPFHMWTPDVYEGAPTPVTAFFAAAPKLAAIALFTRVLVGPFGDMTEEWRQIIWFISVTSMLLGSFAAIFQTSIKRLMAYSSIGNVGYALVGLAAGNQAGVSGLLIYMAIYIVMTLGTFAVILAMRQKGQMVEKIADLAGLSRSQPMLAYAMAIFMFSMAGIPPLGGFFAKFFVFKAAIEAGGTDGSLYALAIIGVLTSVVSAFYYLRIVKVMFFEEPAGGFDPVDGSLRLVLWVTVALILFTVIPPLLVPLTGNAGVAAASLFAG
ncbi:NADH-quinone oxidoreductase subunit NuoN [Dongia soli]|uniref:NADH-quinone oxidoreductase subunit N n=1 Tax=Dongia soli TaxID=600628 RepID=A0ABU5E9U8_9PROT|nr:NADH-quinone oxidoreductase subunit NuoN [Dongia soli]MDY0883019.1 NADH-quinone oxidoreductase subunit NuoN [Dongia soli]